jgi:hypothetical protein
MSFAAALLLGGALGLVLAIGRTIYQHCRIARRAREHSAQVLEYRPGRRGSAS